MPIVIKKRVSLEFLGKDYKDSYLTLRSIPIGEYEKIGDKSIKEVVIDYFIDGEIQQGENKVAVTKDNLLELPGEVFTHGFNVIAGTVDPKDNGQ